MDSHRLPRSRRRRSPTDGRRGTHADVGRVDRPATLTSAGVAVLALARAERAAKSGEEEDREGR